MVISGLFIVTFVFFSSLLCKVDNLFFSVFCLGLTFVFFVATPVEKEMLIIYFFNGYSRAVFCLVFPVVFFIPILNSVDDLLLTVFDFAMILVFLVVVFYNLSIPYIYIPNVFNEKAKRDRI